MFYPDGLSHRTAGRCGHPISLQTLIALLASVALISTVAAQQPGRPSPSAGAPPRGITPPGRTPPGGEPPTSTTAEAEDEDLNTIVSEGKIPIRDFLRFIRLSTGKVVNFPSGPTDDPNFRTDVEIEILGDIDDFTFPMAKAILEVNGYDLWEQELDDGNKIYNVRHFQSRQNPPLDPVVPIHEAKDKLSPKKGDQLATLVLQPKYVDATTVATALRELMEVQGSKSTTGTLKIVQVTQSQTLIVKSRVRLLQHVKDLMKYIDVEETGPEPILEVRDLYNADALDIVDIVRQALDDTTSGTTRRPRTPARPSGAKPSGRSRSSASLLAGQMTRLIPDARTQKIIIQSTNPEEVEFVHLLIDELDSKLRNIRSTTHLYRVKFLKAADLRDTVMQLIEGSTSLTGRSRGRTGRTGQRTAGARGVAGQGQPQLTPSRIVAHEDTNSILIQAEPEEYEEIKNILEQIDKKRRQVFLEAGLVQVSDRSSLNYTIEYLAGNLDDQATRLAGMSAFGLSGPDVSQLPSNLARQFNTGATFTGLLAAVSRQGQLPLLLRAIKTDTDSQVLATPFILADDNQQNEIQVLKTLFFEQTTQGQVSSTAGQDSEDAGITLTLTPTISGNVVMIDLSLEVSDFGSASTGTGSLPDKSTNRVTSRVTIPDGGLFIIGGLARENESLVVDKVPILGDLPIIGRLFQSRASSNSRDNLYVFLTAHIIDDEDRADLQHFTDQAVDGMHTFGEDIRVQNFEPFKGKDTRDDAQTTDGNGEDQ